MFPLETKQSGGKLLLHSDLRGGVFLEEVSHSFLNAGSKIETNEMGGTCGAYGAGERGTQGSDGKT